MWVYNPAFNKPQLQGCITVGIVIEHKIDYRHPRK